MDGVGTSIIGRPRPLSRHRRADDLYTLNCEEPVKRTLELIDGAMIAAIIPMLLWITGVYDTVRNIRF